MLGRLGGVGWGALGLGLLRRDSFTLYIKRMIFTIEL